MKNMHPQNLKTLLVSTDTQKKHQFLITRTKTQFFFRNYKESQYNSNASIMMFTWQHRKARKLKLVVKFCDFLSKNWLVWWNLLCPFLLSLLLLLLFGWLVKSFFWGIFKNSFCWSNFFSNSFLFYCKL